MGATMSAPEYGLKVADASKVRSLNAIAKNTLWYLKKMLFSYIHFQKASVLVFFNQSINI